MSDLKVNVIDHPLIQHKLTLMRQKDTGTKDFRELLEEISMFMAYEITRDFPLKEVDIETPVAKCKSKVLAGKKVGVVPILRAGLGMLSGVVNMIPAARVGHVGMYRDPETLKPVEYYCKLPSDVADRTLIVVDPMLATGGSASAALSLIIGGGLGNLVTRLIHGYVIDFFNFYFWPVFHVADICICVGCALLVYSVLILEPKLKKAETKEEQH